VRIAHAGEDHRLIAIERIGAGVASQDDGGR
jgi:hypothetical protein